MVKGIIYGEAVVENAKFDGVDIKVDIRNDQSRHCRESEMRQDQIVHNKERIFDK